MQNADQVLEDLEKTGVKVASEQVVSYLVANVWVGFGWVVINPVIGWVVGFVISILMQRLDWLTYMLVENWEVTSEARDYVQAAARLAALPPSVDPEDLKKAQDEKVEAFKKLIGLGSPPPNELHLGS